MPLLDNIKDRVTKVIPQKKEELPAPGSTGVGHGLYRGEDMILSKPFIAATSAQIFLAFVTMCCWASVAGFQAKYKVGPSALSVLSIFISLFLLFFSSFLLAVPVVYDRYDKLRGLARSLRITRVSLICNGIGIFFSFLAAFVSTISVATQPGCKNPAKDPNARTGGKAFRDDLPGWCQTKRAAAVFFWLTMIAWLVTMYLSFQEWRTGKTIYKPEDPPFSLPSQRVPQHDEDDADPYTRRRQTTEEDEYEHEQRSPFNDNNRYADYNNPAGRPSMDAYGAFSDPNPSGYGRTQQYEQPPQSSRTMQYADPYAAVRASIHGSSSPPMPQPGQYEYQR
ncbi:hypothetical protein CPB86DRAFT_805457 [Serendipita vermifera]|nr:hypothetical protein CPB86DRAFT_805457 [Serendipita vermifera]